LSKLELYRPRRPSLWDKIRSFTLGPLSIKDPEIRKYFDGGTTSTGMSVSEYTALNYSAVWAAVRLISNTVATLPLDLYKRDDATSLKYRAHPTYRLLKEPNPEMSSFTFRQTLQAHALTWGNGYAEIERDGAGRPRYLWPLKPDRVDPFRDGMVLRYKVAGDGGPDVILDAADVLHVRGLGWDGVQGYSPIAKARESIALGLAAEKFGSVFYGGGSTFGGTITHPTQFKSEETRNNFHKMLKARHKGVEKAHGILLLEEGMTFERIGIPPNEAQFLESREFQIEEIARWFNLPAYKLTNTKLAYNSIEAHSIEFHQALLPWLETWEQELEGKLISSLERNQQYIKHTVEGLLRADAAGRAALEATEFQIGGLTPNEARALADRNPITGGDRAFVQMNMMPLDRLDEYIDAQIESLKPKPTAPPTRSADDEALITELRSGVTAAISERAAAAEAHAKALAELVDDLTAAKVGQEGLRAEVAAEKGLRIATEARVEALTEQLAVNASLLKDADERLQIARSAVEDNSAAMASSEAYGRTWHGRAEALAVEKDELENQILEAVAARDLVASQRDEARTAQAHLAELLDGAQTAIATEQAERAREAAAHAAKVEALEREAFGQSDAIATLTAERDASVGELAAIQDDMQRMRVNLTTAALATDAAVANANQAMEALADADKRTAAAELAKAAAEAAHLADKETMEQRRHDYADRVTNALTAHRAVVVDALGRLVRRETEKARRNQVTPQKLRAWSDGFYSLHRETCEDALEPVIRVHLALSGSAADPREVTKAIVRDHVAHSQAQLRAVVDGEPDEMPQTLERVLSRWESERPGALADRLLKEGVEYVRSIR
jgi:HK97 family phage portal protein